MWRLIVCSVGDDREFCFTLVCLSYVSAEISLKYPYYYTIACYSCGYRFYLLSLVEYSSVYYYFGRCSGFQYASCSIYILFEKIYRSLK